jgi:hypothetical protein
MYVKCMNYIHVCKKCTSSWATPVYIHVCNFGHMRIHIHFPELQTWMVTFVLIYTYIHTYIRTYIHTYTHTHIQSNCDARTHIRYIDLFVQTAYRYANFAPGDLSSTSKNVMFLMGSDFQVCVCVRAGMYVCMYVCVYHTHNDFRTRMCGCVLLEDMLLFTHACTLKRIPHMLLLVLWSYTRKVRMYVCWYLWLLLSYTRKQTCMLKFRIWLTFKKLINRHSKSICAYIHMHDSKTSWIAGTSSSNTCKVCPVIQAYTHIHGSMRTRIRGLRTWTSSSTM